MCVTAYDIVFLTFMKNILEILTVWMQLFIVGKGGSVTDQYRLHSIERNSLAYWQRLKEINISGGEIFIIIKHCHNAVIPVFPVAPHIFSAVDPVVLLISSYEKTGIVTPQLIKNFQCLFGIGKFSQIIA